MRCDLQNVFYRVVLNQVGDKLELHLYVSLLIYEISFVAQASFSHAANPWRTLSFQPRSRIWRGVHWSWEL